MYSGCSTSAHFEHENRLGKSWIIWSKSNQESIGGWDSFRFLLVQNENDIEGSDVHYSFGKIWKIDERSGTMDNA